MSNNQPWSFEQAVGRCQRASNRQESAEQSLREAYVQAAEAEEAYRLELARQILQEHADGIAWTVASDVARGREKVARLRRDRDIAEGVRESMVQAAWRRAADRRDAQRFADWSQRREIAEFHGQAPEAERDLPVIGARQ
jgi:chlorite dismutase